MSSTTRRHATKAELVHLKTELKVAQDGLALLERKRDMLIMEAIERLKQAKFQRQEITQKWRQLQEIWQETLAQEPVHRIRQLAETVPPLAPLNNMSQHWMSIELAQLSLERPQLDLLGSILEVSVRPEQVRGLLSSLMPELVQLMEQETNVRKITQSLKQCHRQVNALKQVIIPELSQARNQIEQRLEEKDREAIFQVKRLKARLS
ncbi:V-type ATP synthase subunit D [Dongshaea marina]|uniref:V-type ATP synthase subunit D n=1 Tax=Dongshaea marina TaxID=2047966 RepID=UPI000D3E282F|nr:V-type ATP synthase subunit D [Dongshaea marina]